MWCKLIPVDGNVGYCCFRTENNFGKIRVKLSQVQLSFPFGDVGPDITSIHVRVKGETGAQLQPREVFNFPFSYSIRCILQRDIVSWLKNASFGFCFTFNDTRAHAHLFSTCIAVVHQVAARLMEPNPVHKLRQLFCTFCYSPSFFFSSCLLFIYFLVCFIILLLYLPCFSLFLTVSLFPLSS